jgi:DNA-binding beta-propeller fold protein YncE
MYPKGTTKARAHSLMQGDGGATWMVPGISYSSLAFSPLTGKLYASVRPSLLGKDKIYIVDTSNGDTTLVGSTGLGVITPHIAFDASGRLFALAGTGSTVNSLYLLDTTSAAATLVGSCGVAGLNAITDVHSSPCGSAGEKATLTPDYVGVESELSQPLQPYHQY